MKKSDTNLVTARNLASLAAEAAQISRMLLDSDGELSPELEALLDVNESQLMEKVDSYRFVIEEMGMHAELWKQRKDACAAQQKKFEGQVERLKDRIKFAMKTMDRAEIVGGFTKFQLRKSKPKLVIDNEAALPADCKMVVQRTVVDTDKVKSALEGGFEVPGARLEENGSLYILENSKKD